MLIKEISRNPCNRGSGTSFIEPPNSFSATSEMLLPTNNKHPARCPAGHSHHIYACYTTLSQQLYREAKLKN